MKNYIIAVAIILVTSVLTVIKKDSPVQGVKIVKSNIALDKNVMGTAD